MKGKPYPGGGGKWDLADRTSIGIRPTTGANADRAHDRYLSGLHHLAWTATSRDDGDALHAKLVAFGATILDPPADYPRYNSGRGYYAVFFADPDGLKLEICVDAASIGEADLASGPSTQGRGMSVILMRWAMGLTIALSATATYALALIYFSPDATIRFGRTAGLICLASMFAGVAFVRGQLGFRQLVPLAGAVAAGLTLFFAALVLSSGLAPVPGLAFIVLPLLPIVLFGAVVLVRMLIRVW